jgi:cell wall-associated NlpC family hydrolase
LPLSVARIVAAANEIQGKPYIWGGGHRYLVDRGYDCSGSVSYVLFKAGLLRGPLTAHEFRGYGAPRARSLPEPLCQRRPRVLVRVWAAL